MSDQFDLPRPAKVTFGAIGPVGGRAFFLQASDGNTAVTLKIEKQQAAALSTHLASALGDLGRPGHLPEGDELELDAFGVADFVVGSLAIAYDEGEDRIVLIAREATDDEDASGAEARISMSKEQAAALAIRGTQLVESGRPPCPLCGYPLDPGGHNCPRTNGHAAPQL
jgi:uncharacterized repeat protein (TIGR03847 family)